MRASIVFLIAMFFATPTAAQQGIDFGAAAAAADQASQPATAPSAVPTLDTEYARARLAYDKFSLEHAQRTFVWQYWSGVVVFVVVMTIVIVGLWLSFLHFYLHRHGGGQLKLTTDGVEINSPVIGLLILVLSLGFFYLYLSQVYPITEVKL